MEKITKKGLEKELKMLFAGGKTDDYIKDAVKKLSDFTGTDVAEVFQKLAFAVDILSKMTGCSTIQVLSFTVSLSALSSMFSKLGSNLKSVTPPVEEDGIFSALMRYQDSELKAEAVGLVDLLFTVNAYLSEINEKTHESVVIKLEDQFPTKDIVRFMGKLKAKTYEQLTNFDPQSARRATLYINLYFRLANLRTLVLWQVFCIKLRSSFDQSTTQGVFAMINESHKSDFEVLRYVTETSFKKIVFHTLFHPTENENFLHFICIQRLKIPSIGHNRRFCGRTHFIRSSKMPAIAFEMMSPKAGGICGSQNKSFASKFHLEPLHNRKLDDIFYIRSVKWSDSYIAMDEGGKCVSVSGKPGFEGQWKIVKMENDGLLPQYIFSTPKWPCKFLFMKSCWTTYSVEGTENYKASRENCLFEILDV